MRIFSVISKKYSIHNFGETDTECRLLYGGQRMKLLSRILYYDVRSSLILKLVQTTSVIQYISQRKL